MDYFFFYIIESQFKWISKNQPKTGKRKAMKPLNPKTMKKPYNFIRRLLSATTKITVSTLTEPSVTTI